MHVILLYFCRGIIMYGARELRQLNKMMIEIMTMKKTTTMNATFSSLITIRGVPAIFWHCWQLRPGVVSVASAQAVHIFSVVFEKPWHIYYWHPWAYYCKYWAPPLTAANHYARCSSVPESGLCCNLNHFFGIPVCSWAWTIVAEQEIRNIIVDLLILDVWFIWKPTWTELERNSTAWSWQWSFSQISAGRRRSYYHWLASFFTSTDCVFLFPHLPALCLGLLLFLFFIRISRFCFSS